ncbi:HAD family hydrolase [Gemmiger sp.]
MNLTEQICHKAARFDAVAFDVFDTLIKRDVAAPTNLFRLRGEAFYAARIEAERVARAAKNGEVTLAEIYAQPCLAGYDAADECAAELAACTAYRPVWEAVQALKRQGKKLYYISDMYLPQTQIDAMLRRCGYPCFDGGFVSCTYGVQKRSGKLFKQFLHETELDAKRVLFIGDSWRADVAGAALAGIPAWHLPTPELPETDLDAFIQNRLPLQKTAGEALGFAVLGPLAAAFCRWLHDRRAVRPQARLYFLARDMYLMRDVYHTLYPDEETEYLRVSRRSLAPAFLAAGEFAAVLAALPRQRLTGAQIAAYCGTNCPPETAVQTFDLKHPDEAALTAFLQTLPPPAGAEAATAYLNKKGIRSGDILVDIGSGGTTQLLLEKLLKIELHGMQLSADDRLRTRFAPAQTEVFLFDGAPAPRLYWAGQPMLERLISEDVGATLGYTVRGDAVTVITEPQEPSLLVKEIQAGVQNFAAAWRESVLQNQPIPPQKAIAPFLRLVESPTAQQAALLGGLTVEDGGTYPLAAPENAAHYLTHPRKAKQDFADARWKIGFLKRLAPLPLPYGKLYLKLKK